MKGKLPPRMKDPITPPMVPILEKPKLGVSFRNQCAEEHSLCPITRNMPNFGVTKLRQCAAGLERARAAAAAWAPAMAADWAPGTAMDLGRAPAATRVAAFTRSAAGFRRRWRSFTPEAEFSDEARRAKYQGVCLISLIVDAQGNPQDPRVIRPLGMGLDEKALEAVRKYKFKPAMKDGRRLCR